MLRLFPLLLLPVIFYNLIALVGGGFLHYDLQDLFNYHSTIKMFSGEKWRFSGGDVLVLITLGLLFVDTVKATRTTSGEISRHGLSMLTFSAALIEFITLKGFATTPFFFITVMCLFDVIAGYTISIVAAEHDLGLGRAGTD